ncbi:unnamed protein product [Lepeophtheirus salmonis]|uniref:(salmon louse) hypothetical protein n=1 Tax=Lepeophtheirus salmonis TaxID=72036 RepID=A0A7R8H3U9_LEPSM|nr:unnamed protein product [Lepeophtheirus salmonis]CAF2849135.1 unnamed protein product [Lepeophtheirus salmonis]
MGVMRPLIPICLKLQEGLGFVRTNFIAICYILQQLMVGLNLAIYYGNLTTALLLQSQGIYDHQRDMEGYTPLDLLALDSINTSSKPTLFVWGKNLSGLGYKFGTISYHPEVHQFYNENFICPKKIQISGYCSGVLDSKGSLFIAGASSDGMLGKGQFHRFLREPVKLLPLEEIIDFAFGRTHSILLIKSSKETPLPRLLSTTFNNVIIGVGASSYFSCCWSKCALYGWGLNLGQMGFEFITNNHFIESPRLVYTLNNNMKIRQDEKIKPLQFPFKSIKKVQIMEEYCFSTQRHIIPLKMYILSGEETLYSWSAKFGLLRCQALRNHINIPVHDFFVSKENLFVVSSDTHFSLQIVKSNELRTKKIYDSHDLLRLLTLNSIEQCFQVKLSHSSKPDLISRSHKKEWVLDKSVEREPRRMSYDYIFDKYQQLIYDDPPTAFLHNSAKSVHFFLVDIHLNKLGFQTVQ